MEPGSLSSAFTEITGRRLSRLIWFFALIIALVGLGTVIVPWSFSFSTTALRDEAAVQIRQATGLTTLFHGRAVFALLPQPHIKIEQISFGDPSGALHIDADYFKGNLRVLPLFVGRLEIASATLLKPRLVIDLDKKRLPEDSAIGRAAEAKPDSEEAAAADSARLGIVSLVNGTARIASQSMTSDVIVDNIDMTLDWRNLSAPASLTGKARVRGQAGTIAAWIAAPAELLRGGRSQMTLDVKADVLSLTTNGMLNMAAKPDFSGHLRAESPSLPKLLESIGYPISYTGPLNRFRLTSNAKANVNGVSFSELELSLAGSEFEGSLAIEAGEQKPLLSGTLATDLLALDPYFAHLQPLIVADTGQWTQELFDFHTMMTTDVDLRVSAARARFSHFEIQDAALSLIAHDDRLDLSMAQAKAYHGLLKARATVNIGQDGLTLHAATSVTDLDVGSLSWDIAGLPEITGTASGTANVEATGSNLLELMRHLDGRLQLRFKQGDVRSISLGQLSLPQQPEANNPSLKAADAPSTRIPYDQAQLSIKVVKGAAEVEQGLADGPGGHLLLSGTAALPDRKIDVRAVILPTVHDESLANSAQNLNIIIKGQWDHPLIAPAAP